MLKIYFNTVVPYCERKKVLKAFKELGFTFERLFVPGSDVSRFVFRGRLPCSSGTECSFANFVFDDESRKQLKGVCVDFVELFINFEKRC